MCEKQGEAEHILYAIIGIFLVMLHSTEVLLGKCIMNALHEMTILNMCNVKFVVSLLSRLVIGKVYDVDPSRLYVSVEATRLRPGRDSLLML